MMATSKIVPLILPAMMAAFVTPGEAAPDGEFPVALGSL
jgi:hypothetical protein